MIPRVYAAISAVTAELARCGIAKAGFNLDDGYDYRRIDDVYERLAPLLAAHRLCILPRVLARRERERPGLGGETLVSVTVRAAFDLVSAEDGSVHTLASFGEALDPGDKATAKAITAAYKQAVIQTFCVPVDGLDDADARSPRRGRALPPGEPVEGWTRWSADLEARLERCPSRAALDRVQSGSRALLAALQRERPELYAQLGAAIAARRAALGQAAAAGPGGPAPADDADRAQAAPDAPPADDADRAQAAPGPASSLPAAPPRGGLPAGAGETARDEPRAARRPAQAAPAPPAPAGPGGADTARAARPGRARRRVGEPVAADG